MPQPFFFPTPPARPATLGPPAPPATPATSAPEGDRPATWDDVITATAKKYQIDPRLAIAMAKTESSMNPQAVSPAGARGLMQLMPATAARHGVNIDDPIDNIRGGMMELRSLLDQHGGDVTMALRRYNGSPQAPDAVTEPYVQKVLGQLKASGAPQAVQPQQSPSTAGYQTVPPPLTPQAAAGPPPTPSWLSGFADEATRSVRAIPGTLKAANDQAVQFLQHPIDKTLAVNRAATEAIMHPINTAAQVFGPQIEKLRAAAARMWEKPSFDTVTEAALTAKNVPLEAVGLGTRMQEAEDFMRQGEVAKGLGATADIGLNVAGPELLAKGMRVTPRFLKPSRTPAELAAVEMGLREKIPVDVATASGSGFAKNIQAAAEATPLGSAVQGIVRGERQEALPRLADKLADRVHPSHVTPSQAGAELTTGVKRYIEDAHQTANTNYDLLRQVEADPALAQSVQVGTTNQWAPNGTLVQVPIMETMPLPADLRAAKVRLAPLRDQTLRTMPLARQQMSPGLLAINQILDGPDYVPASVLDRNLGAIKELARGADMPELRDVSQGLASQAIRALEDAHAVAIRPAGPAAQRALQEGRAATRAKWAAQEIFDKLGDEPVGAFRGTVRSGDASFEHLRDVAKLAPKEVPKIGRAVLEDIFEHASGLEEGWSRELGAARKWEQIGDKTKTLLYGSRKTDLDQFFLLQKMLAARANPSRTALVGTSIGSLSLTAFNPVWGIATTIGAGGFAALMNSRFGIRLLTKGLSIPAGTPRAAAWTAAVLNQLHSRGGLDQVGTPPPQPGLHLTITSDRPATSPPPPPPQ